MLVLRCSGAPVLPAWLQALAQVEASDAELEPLSEEEAAEAAEAEVRTAVGYTDILLQHAFNAGKSSKVDELHLRVCGAHGQTNLWTRPPAVQEDLQRNDELCSHPLSFMSSHARLCH